MKRSSVGRRSDYDFSPVSPIGHNDQLLINAGNKVGVRSLATGRLNSTLQAAAIYHALFQAKIGVQGHQLWEKRVQELMSGMPQYRDFRECAAESWPDEDAVTAAAEMYKSWRQSPGHWAQINGRCDIYGYSMAYNERKRTWYACAIFADARANRR